MAPPVGEKTEPATPKRRQEARKEGNVARSQDFNTAMIILFGALLIFYLGGSMLVHLKDTMRMIFSNLFYDKFDVDTLYFLIVEISAKNLKGTLPIMGGVMVIGLIGSFSQVGFLFSPKAVAPKFNKLNPITGVKNLVSKKSLVRLLMSLVKLAIMAVVAYFAIRKDIEPLMELMSMRTEGIFYSATGLIFGLTMKIAIILMIMAIIDFMYQRWQYSKDLMMTKTEVKQETKQTEGDPLVKSRVKTIQREMANKRMMSEVPEADVVVSNPTHYSVALKYDATVMSAPKVVAKGIDLIALKIRELAKKNDVPIIEDRVLARVLYSTVEIDSEVPPKLYQAVAKVLSYVYQLRNLVGK